MRKIVLLLCIAAAISLSVASVETAMAKQNPAPMIAADNPAFQPFQQHYNFSFDPTQGSNGRTFTVPSGKRLVIEFVSATVGLEMGSAVDSGVVTTVNGVTGTHHLVLAPQGAAWGFPMSWIFSKDMRVYADPGTAVTVFATDNLTGNGVMDVTISGYLVDVP